MSALRVHARDGTPILIDQGPQSAVIRGWHVSGEPAVGISERERARRDAAKYIAANRDAVNARKRAAR